MTLLGKRGGLKTGMKIHKSNMKINDKLKSKIAKLAITNKCM